MSFVRGEPFVEIAAESPKGGNKLSFYLFKFDPECEADHSCSNGDLLIDRLPGHERVWLVGAGSGHGFKHGPAVGARVARHVADPAYPIEPRFSLAAKEVVARRTVY
jgi:hypothetical protein